MRLRILLAALALAVASGACTGGDGDSTSASSTIATAGSPSAAASSGLATASPEPAGSAEGPVTPSPTESSIVPSTTEPAVVSFVAEAYEWKYEPESWTVVAGEDITVELDNRGGTEHDWTILRLGERITKLSEFEDDMVLFQIDAVPRQESVSATFRIDEPGTYQVICTLSGHFNTGMGGTLVVR